jgi:hypothetical protein
LVRDEHVPNGVFKYANYRSVGDSHIQPVLGFVLDMCT